MCGGFFFEFSADTLDRHVLTHSFPTRRSSDLDGGDKVKFFEGTPIPTSLAIVILLAVAAFLGRTGGDLWFGVWQLGPWQLHPLVLVYALSGTPMVSKTLRIHKPLADGTVIGALLCTWHDPAGTGCATAGWREGW